MNRELSNPPAVVVGLCAHGLALTRCLHRARLIVYGIEANENLPGVKTNSARVILVQDINGPGLIDALITLRSQFGDSGNPVLFLTNDRMIKTVGSCYDRVKKLYLVSWGQSHNQILNLLSKESIVRRCAETGLSHPDSFIVRRDFVPSDESIPLTFPIIVKPVMPLSDYKAMVIENQKALERAWPKLKRALPAVAQEFIRGGDSNIRFAALYLAEGEVVSRYEGRKLRSRPMGHTTIAIGEMNDEVHNIAMQFFENLNLSGPVSLEVKKDANGEVWVIEPTVGRTDFWVGLCINDGVRLPLCEFFDQSKIPFDSGRQKDQRIWINGERDPLALLWLLLRFPAYLLRRKAIGVYLDSGDLAPLARSIVIATRFFFVRLRNRIYLRSRQET